MERASSPGQMEGAMMENGSIQLSSNMLWSAVGTSWNHGVMYENPLYDAVGVGSGTAAEFGTWFQAVLFFIKI